MKSNRYFKFASLFMVLFLGGCVASFEPGVSSPGAMTGGLPTSKGVQEGLEVSLEEYVSANKSRHAFDADIASNGILPLLLRVENQGTKQYIVRRDQVRAFLNGQALPPIYGKEAAKQGAARDYVGKAIVNTVLWGPLALYFGLPSIVASVAHTQSVNKDIEQHFESLEFSDTILKPEDTAVGFVFFELPGSMKRLENLTVEVTVEADAYEEQREKQLAYKFPFPMLEVSNLAFRPSDHETNGGNGTLTSNDPFHDGEDGIISKGTSVKNLSGPSLLISGLPGDGLVDSSGPKRVD